MKLRPATSQDADSISTLIFEVKHFFTLNENGEGAEEFLKSISPSSIATYIAAENFNYFVATVYEELAGVVAIRDNKHLFHLFVAPKFQQQKVARQLWLHAKTYATESGNNGDFTVNSTPNAVPVYERFGFKIAGPRVEMHGIASIPMKLTV